MHAEDPQLGSSGCCSVLWDLDQNISNRVAYSMHSAKHQTYWQLYMLAAQLGCWSSQIHSALRFFKTLAVQAEYVHVGIQNNASTPDRQLQACSARCPC